MPGREFYYHVLVKSSFCDVLSLGGFGSFLLTLLFWGFPAFFALIEILRHAGSNDNAVQSAESEELLTSFKRRRRVARITSKK